MQPFLEEMGVPIMAQTAYRKHTCEDAIFAKFGSNEPQEDQVMMFAFNLEKAIDLIEFSVLLNHLLMLGLMGKGGGC